jgi:hypothetical protein
VVRPSQRSQPQLSVVCTNILTHHSRGQCILQACCLLTALVCSLMCCAMGSLAVAIPASLALW